MRLTDGSEMGDALRRKVAAVCYMRFKGVITVWYNAFSMDRWAQHFEIGLPSVKKWVSNLRIDTPEAADVIGSVSRLLEANLIPLPVEDASPVPASAAGAAGNTPERQALAFRMARDLTRGGASVRAAVTALATGSCGAGREEQKKKKSGKINASDVFRKYAGNATHESYIAQLKEDGDVAQARVEAVWEELSDQKFDCNQLKVG